MRRTVWIVNPFDELPEEGSRPMRYWLMAEAFAADGWRVRYWTSAFSHARKVPRKLALARTDDGAPIAIKLIPTPSYEANVSIGRIWSLWRMARNWRRLAVCGEEHPELIIASQPPLLLAREVRRWARRIGAKFVLDVQDAWPETFERILPRWLLAPLRALARGNYRGADLVTTVAERYRELIGREAAVFRLGVRLPSSSCGRSPNGTSMRLLYLGALGRTYDLETILRALPRLPTAQLTIAGEGGELPRLQALSRSLNIAERVHFVGYLKAAELQQLLYENEIGIIPMSSASWVGIPNKLADYAAYGLKIVSSLEGESLELIQHHRAGAWYRPGDGESFVAAVKTAAECSVDGPLDLARALDAEVIYPQYVRHIASLF